MKTSSESLIEKKKHAGSLGGKATVAKYGSQHMANIGKIGAKVFWNLYQLVSVKCTGYAIVRKSDSVIVRILNNPRH